MASSSAMPAVRTVAWLDSTIDEPRAATNSTACSSPRWIWTHGGRKPIIQASATSAVHQSEIRVSPTGCVTRGGTAVSWKIQRTPPSTRSIPKARWIAKACQLAVQNISQTGPGPPGRRSTKAAVAGISIRIDTRMA